MEVDIFPIANPIGYLVRMSGYGTTTWKIEIASLNLPASTG